MTRLKVVMEFNPGRICLNGKTDNDTAASVAVGLPAVQYLLHLFRVAFRYCFPDLRGKEGEVKLTEPEYRRYTSCMCVLKATFEKVVLRRFTLKMDGILKT